MTIYALELYDKDNDIYEIISYSSDVNELRLRGSLIEYLIKRDMIVRYCSDGSKEPFDSIRIRQLESGEDLDKKKLFF